MPEISGDSFIRAELVQTLAAASGASGMAGGQMMDIVAGERQFDLHTVTRLQQLKTGALLAAAVEMGAILGRCPEEGRAHLRAYSRDIGLAYQIADDLLDYDGDEGKAGKSLRKDTHRGKATFVSLMGADKARHQAQALAEQAVGHLAGHGEEADILRALARFMVERDR
jgi:farnesyl diphosphate synthase